MWKVIYPILASLFRLQLLNYKLNITTFESVSELLIHLRSYRDSTMSGLLCMSWLNLRRLGCTGLQVPVGLSHTGSIIRNFLQELPYAMSLVRMNTNFVP